MTHDNQPISLSDEPTSSHFGDRLRTARESLGHEAKDIAAQLRLNPNIILMLESSQYPQDLPLTFLRGYLRSYARFLQIPEQELNDALANIKQKAAAPAPSAPATPTERGFIAQLCLTRDEFSRSSNRFMQVFTYVIVFTLIGLVGSWWVGHTPTSAGIHEVIAAAASINQPAPAPAAAQSTQAAQAAPVTAALVSPPAATPGETVAANAVAGATAPQATTMASAAPTNSSTQMTPLLSATVTKPEVDDEPVIASNTVSNNKNIDPDNTETTEND